MAQHVNITLWTPLAALLTNGLGHINREVNRRPRVASIFPQHRCLRLVSALLNECGEDWMTGKTYLNLQT